MLVADWVAEVFLKNRIDRIFLYPGGTIAPLINACLKVGIKVECFKNEQGAAYAALAYGRMTGRPQVVMVTSGPGVTNAITPLADGYYDSTPLVLVTGQIGTPDLSSRTAVRQRGFQETPTVAITRPISKRSSCMLSVEDVFREVPNAFDLAVAERRGPVVIDFPMDMQRREIAEAELPSVQVSASVAETKKSLNVVAVDEICAAAASAYRPVVLLGQGALSDGLFEEYKHLVASLDALVVTSFLGVGAFDTEDGRALGYVGHTGHLAANRAVHECDFLLVLGSRLDVRQTGTMVNRFVPNGRVAWVVADPDELANPRVAVSWKLETSVEQFCRAFHHRYPGKRVKIDPQWLTEMMALKDARTEDRPHEQSQYLQPRPVLETMGRIIGDSAVTVVTGVGCHQHWTARHLSFRPGRRLLTSGGHGAMGYDLPSAIGAAIARPDRRVLCVVGDGSLLMNIQELAALKERNLDVKLLVMNNSRLGIVSQFQLITWGSDPTTGDFVGPDFAAIAKAFGIAAKRLEHTRDTEHALSWLWHEEGPALLDARIDPGADVVPMLLAGQTMGEMWMGSKS